MEAEALGRAGLQIFQASRRLAIDFVVASEGIPDFLSQRRISLGFLEDKEYRGVELVRQRLPVSQKQLSRDIFQVIDILLVFWGGLVSWDELFKVVEVIRLPPTLDGT